YDASRTYDAANRQIITAPYDDAGSPVQFPTVDSFDGDGNLLKRVQNSGSTDPAAVTNYFIRSTPLNKVICEADSTGKSFSTYIPANGATLAEQQDLGSVGSPFEYLLFLHQDASNVSIQQTTASGFALGREAEYDPTGRNVVDPLPYFQLNT